MSRRSLSAVLALSLAVLVVVSLAYLFVYKSQNSPQAVPPLQVVNATVANLSSVSIGSGLVNGSAHPFFRPGIGGYEISLNLNVVTLHCTPQTGPCGVSIAAYTVDAWDTVLMGGRASPFVCLGVNNSCGPIQRLNTSVSLTALGPINHWMELVIWNNQSGVSFSAEVTEGVPVDGTRSALVASVSATPQDLILGSSTNVFTQVSGGVSEYGGTTPEPLFYSYAGLPNGCTAYDVSSFSCTPSQVGNYSVVLVVMDSYLQESSASVSVTIFT